MAVSKTRWAFRFVLLAIIAGVGFLGLNVFNRRGSEHLRLESEQQYKLGKRKNAIDLLTSFVGKNRNDGGSHFTLAQWLLEEERTKRPEATYANTLNALKHLEIAAKLREDDLKLQREALLAKLMQQRLFDAAGYAVAVRAKDPNDADALFTLAWYAIEQKRYRDSEGLITDLDRAEQTQARQRDSALPPFRTWWVKTQLYRRTKNADALRDVLEQFSKTAGSIPASLLASLDEVTRRYLDQLILLSVNEATDLTTAQFRASDAMSALEKLQQVEVQRKEAAEKAKASKKQTDETSTTPVSNEGEEGADPTEQAANSRIREIASAAAKVRLFLWQKYLSENPQNVAATFQLPQMRNVNNKMLAIGEKAIEVDEADPFIFYQTAEAMRDTGQVDNAMTLLIKGLDNADKLPSFKNERKMILALHSAVAEQLAREGRIEEAEKHLPALIENESTAGEGHLLAGRVAARIKNWEEAVGHYTQARKKLGDLVHVRIFLAMAYLEMGRFDEAMPLFETLYGLDAKKLPVYPQKIYQEYIVHDNRLHLLHTKCLLGLGKIDKAREHLAKLQGTDYETDAIIELTDFFEIRGQVGAARELLVKAYDNSRHNDRKLFDRIVKLLVDGKQYEQAGEVIEDFYSRHADNQEQMLAPMNFWQKYDYPDRAIRYIDEMIKRLPENTLLLAAKADLLNRRQEYDEQMKIYDRMERIQPDWAQPHLFKADLYRQLGSREKAVESLTKALALEPKNTKARSMRIQLHIDKGAYDLALNDVNELVKAEPLLLDASFQRAEILTRLGRRTEAEELLENLMVTAPTEPRIYAQLARLHADFGNTTKALGIIKTAFTRIPDNDLVTEAKIHVLVRANQIAELDQVRPESADAWMWKASAWMAINQQERGIDCLEEALKRDANHANARMALATQRMARGELIASLAHLTAVLRRDPRNWDAHLMRAQVQVALGQRDSAVATLKRLVDGDPKRASGHLTLAQVYASRAETRPEALDEAIAALERGAVELPNDLSLVQMHVELLVRANRQEALDKVRPLDPEVCFYKALAWRNRSQPEKALRELDRALLLNAEHYGARRLAIEVALAMTKNDEALGHIEEALRRRGPLWDLMQLKANALVRMDRRNDAIELLKGVQREQPRTNTAVYVWLARLHLDATPAQVDEALAVIDLGLGEIPNDPRLMQEKITILVDQSRRPDLDKLDPGSAQTSYQKAMAWRSRNRLDDAMLDLQRCLNLEPNHLNAHNLAAEIALAQRKFDVSLNHSRAVELLDRHAHAARLIQSDALRGLGRRVEAKDVLESVIKDRPSMVVAHAKLADLFLELKDTDSALKTLRDGKQYLAGVSALMQAELRILCEQGHVEEALKLADDTAGERPDFHVCTSLTQAFVSAGQFDTALKWVERALKQADEFQKPQARIAKGIVMQALAKKNNHDAKQYEESLALFRSVLAMDANDYTAANNAAWVLSEGLRRPAEALALLEKTRGSTSIDRLPASVVDTLVRTYRRLNRLADARAALESALKVYPNVAEMQFHLGMVLAGEKKFAEAATTLRKALELGLGADDEAEARKLLDSLDKAALAPAAPIPAAPKPAEPKKAEPQKAEPQKAEPKKAEPQKAEPQKASP